jgi:hypothetical protein
MSARHWEITSPPDRSVGRSQPQLIHAPLHLIHARIYFSLHEYIGHTFIDDFRDRHIPDLATPRLFSGNEVRSRQVVPPAFVQPSKVRSINAAGSGVGSFLRLIGARLFFQVTWVISALAPDFGARSAAACADDPAVDWTDNVHALQPQLSVSWSHTQPSHHYMRPRC